MKRWLDWWYESRARDYFYLGVAFFGFVAGVIVEDFDKRLMYFALTVLIVWIWRLNRDRV